MSSNLGSINERGIIKGFERKGFTPEKCLSEIVANSIDAGAAKIMFVITSTHIDVIDWGRGMTLENVRNMLDLHRENHGTHQALGVSGLGWKPATFILSGKQLVLVYTRAEGGNNLLRVSLRFVSKSRGTKSMFPANIPICLCVFPHPFLTNTLI